MNTVDIILVVLIAAAVVFALRSCKRHKHSCGCCTGDCSQCAAKFKE
ncbi:MAG: FeoB-associated Cys-rich membrane protein [Ruminococcus sp.]|nr:FeoB-associated Cys-rich membrane protein [Ruminococcus sp.]MBP3796217.1 FeoB-associated Cys-rich membrane protein [Ruminococcus sp.]